jgi:hypothetical protein
LVLFLGAVGIGRAIVVQHTLVEAARAGCRLRSVSNQVEEQEIYNFIDNVMNNAGLTGYSVALLPELLDDIQHMDAVQVSVSIPYDRIPWFVGSEFLAGQTLTGTCIMPSDTSEDVPGSF